MLFLTRYFWLLGFQLRFWEFFVFGYCRLHHELFQFALKFSQHQIFYFLLPLSQLQASLSTPQLLYPVMGGAFYIFPCQGMPSQAYTISLPIDVADFSLELCYLWTFIYAFQLFSIFIYIFKGHRGIGSQKRRTIFGQYKLFGRFRFKMFSKSSPMKNSSLSKYQLTPQNHKDLNVLHLTRSHHPNSLYNSISNQFVNGIQSSNNPSNNYQLKMNHIYKDKLKSGLTEFQNRKLNLQTQYTHNQKQYRENINGVLGYIEKEDKRHNEEMITRLKKQEQRYRTFIDEDKVKNRRAVSLINKQYDPKVFFYQSEKQDVKRQTMEKDMWKKNKQLSCKKQEKENYIKKMKEQDQNLRRSQEQFLKTQAFKQATLLKKEQKNYQKNLIKMIEEKNTKKPRLQLTLKPHRHNPITNPIEYHIQNPYFLREMQKNKT